MKYVPSPLGTALWWHLTDNLRQLYAVSSPMRLLAPALKLVKSLSILELNDFRNTVATPLIPNAPGAPCREYPRPASIVPLDHNLLDGLRSRPQQS